MKYTGMSTKPRGRVAMYIAHKTRGFLMLYMFYITTTPYLPCNNNNINRKELYDFYYTAITWEIIRYGSGNLSVAIT